MNKNLEDLSKEQLIKLVKSLKKEVPTRRIPTQDELDYMEEEHYLNEAYMESHGRIDYGYGIGVYGPR